MSHRSSTSVACALALLMPAAVAYAAPITLAQILAHADVHAPAVRLARAEAGRGDAEVEAASPLLPEDPELEIGAGPRLSAGGRGVDVEVALTQRLELAGERGLRIEVAKRERTLLGAGLQQARWRVHRQVHAAYHVALVARERATAAVHAEKYAGRLLEITNKRHAAGAISLLHVRMAEAELSQARQRTIRARSAYGAARLTLAEVAGWPAGKLPEPAGGLDPPKKAPSARRLTELALQHHPELRGRRAAIRAAEARVALARREAFPKPTLGVAYSREAEIGGEANHIVVGSLGLAIPLWQRNRGARARAAAEVAVARARHEALRRALSIRVRRAAAALDAGARRIGLYGRQVAPALERGMAMIERAFREGKVDVLQVMVARSRVLASQRETLDAYEDYYQAHAALEAVVGAEIWEEGKR